MTEAGSVMATPPEPPPQPVFKEPRPVNSNSLPFFSRIVEDIIVKIFGRLEDDPRDLARLACVCRRFHCVIKTSSYKGQCMRVVPSIVSELLQSSSRQGVLVEPPGGWQALQKVLVCCPGLLHAGVLLNCWDYGLEREIGRSDDFEIVRRDDVPKFGVGAQGVHDTGTVNTLDVKGKQEKNGDLMETQSQNPQLEDKTNVKTEIFSGTCLQPGVKANVSANDRITREMDSCNESDTVGTITAPEGEHYQCVTSELRGIDTTCASESFHEADADATSTSGKKELIRGDGPIKQMKKGDLHYHGKVMKEPKFHGSYRRSEGGDEHGGSRSPRIRERRRSKERGVNSGGVRRSIQMERCTNHEEEPHLAKGIWTLTREQGNKLLASRFRSDSLYLCDWPGCMHQGERRVYKLFRGIFKNFQHSHVFRNLKDLRSRRTEIRCAFCSEETYDMVTSFCLRRSFEYHEDGEPVIRAYVCDNGHVAGAWTDRPLYNL